MIFKPSTTSHAIPLTSGHPRLASPTPIYQYVLIYYRDIVSGAGEAFEFQLELISLLKMCRFSINKLQCIIYNMLDPQQSRETTAHAGFALPTQLSKLQIQHGGHYLCRTKMNIIENYSYLVILYPLKSFEESNYVHIPQLSLSQVSSVREPVGKLWSRSVELRNPNTKIFRNQ